jgi:uncharacterized membrane protein YjgN (DUF898 family)
MEYQNFELAYKGKHEDYFKIWIVNVVLTALTLGLYYPWARANTLKYFYSQTTFDSQPFAFIGTGKEMFIGFIKAILIILVAYSCILIPAIFFEHNSLFIALGFLVYGLLLMLIVPFALHGSLKYRLAKTIWKGIRFGYTGDKMELSGIFIKGFFLTIFTFGIYSSWFAINLRKYMIANIKIGNANFSYSGNGTDFFLLNLKGYLLTIVTLGIYSFWWQRDLFNYVIDNTNIEQNDKAIFFKSRAKGIDFLILMVTNFLIVVLTLGLATPIAISRKLTFLVNCIEAKGIYSFADLQQSQDDYNDATGADVMGMLDISF